MTTTNNDADAIRAEIDRTRGRLSEDVDVLTESVRPSSVAKRTVQRTTGRASRLKENVMGTAHDTTSLGADKAHDAADTVKDVPDMAMRKARGNPLAAGVVALAAGWLVGSMLPASAKERELASTVKDKAEPLVDEAKSLAQETAQGLQEPAQQAVQSVKDTAQQGVEHVRDDGTSAVEDVKETASSASQGGSTQAGSLPAGSTQGGSTQGGSTPGSTGYTPSI